jgi:hypothetical protein
VFEQEAAVELTVYVVVIVGETAIELACYTVIPNIS